MPDKVSPLDKNSWAVVVTYEPDGDKDAEKINYSELLTQMQKNVASANEERQKAGHEPVHSIGWAKAPRYDSHTQAILGEGGEIRFTAGQHAQLQYTNAWPRRNAGAQWRRRNVRITRDRAAHTEDSRSYRLQSGTSIR